MTLHCHDLLYCPLDTAEHASVLIACYQLLLLCRAQKESTSPALSQMTFHSLSTQKNPGLCLPEGRDLCVTAGEEVWTRLRNPYYLYESNSQL